MPDKHSSDLAFKLQQNKETTSSEEKLSKCEQRFEYTQVKQEYASSA